MGEVDTAQFDAFATLRAEGARSIDGHRMVYQCFAPRFVAFLRRRGTNKEDCADIVQDTFLRAFQSAEKMLSAARPQAYLWQIFIRAHVDWHRERRRRVPVVSVDPAEDLPGKNPWFEIGEPSEGGADATLMAAVRADLADCFQRASRAYLDQYPRRAAFLDLHVIAQLSGEEIAAAIGRPNGATRTFLSECRRLFLQVLEKVCGPSVRDGTEQSA